MTVDELPAHLGERWPRLREQLFAGTYQPAQVKQQLIILGSCGTDGEMPGSRQSPCHDEGLCPSHHEADGRAKH
jgi:hypothetical protein